jgi:TonB family protein
VGDSSRIRGSKTGPGITVVASSRSGGAFNFYGALKGDPVYTIYLETSLGVAVLQYADPTSTRRVYAHELSAPEPMRASLPAGLGHSRLVIACVLDQEGQLNNLRVLEPGPAQMTASVVAALRNWKFKPAFRADQPVEVNAILGFNIDTR